MTANSVFIPSGRHAVMAQRHEPPDSLDYFPTPPFATRAFCEHVLGLKPLSAGRTGFLTHRFGALSCAAHSVWEPACGEGHMAATLAEYFPQVHASDVHDYGGFYEVGSFVGEGLDRAEWPHRDARGFGGPDWIITNPPFNLGIEFVRRALEEAGCGVAVLLRSVWMETEERYEFFKEFRPDLVAVYSERVAMHRNRWVVNGSTATSYAWFVWFVGNEDLGPTQLMLIPPGRKKALTRPSDSRQFPAWREIGRGKEREYVRIDTEATDADQS